MAQRHDYSIIVLSVLLLVGIVAIVIIFQNSKSGFEGQVYGRAADPAIEVPPQALEAGILEFGVPNEMEIRGHTYTALYFSGGISIDDFLYQPPGFGFGDNLYFQVVSQTDTSIMYFIYDRAFAPSCDGVEGQIKELGPGYVCCEGIPFGLPECDDPAAEPLECGNRIIYCEDSRLVAKPLGAR